jgi:PKD repeat protein
VLSKLATFQLVAQEYWHLSVNQAPVISSFTGVPSNPENPGGRVTFDAAATDADGDSLSYVLDFGDGTPSWASSHADHVYESAGTYAATVSVSDGHGNSVLQSIQIIVSDIPSATPEGVSVD